ncbi:hypothetical protein CEP52_015293 [Fusarium oligoseptatum]|uniref:Pre-mRNA-splicing factor CWC24 n=1 Tax=Fusarium oligoseptatum TaxID=2604345 RepID=A0A428SEI2_9HYPO|nr:hypothetical protein CEP52_015293 [Fusarium oligoseptatum]
MADSNTETAAPVAIDYSSSEDESGQRVKRRKKTVTVTASSKDTATREKELTATVYAADRSVPITSTNDATKHSNWYDEDSKDALSAKNLLGSSRSTTKDSQPDGTYKGLSNQTSFIQKEPRCPHPIQRSDEGANQHPNDYGHGLQTRYLQRLFENRIYACIYLHDRTDIKQGWQLDREWEIVTKGKKNLGGTVIASANRDKKEEVEEDEAEIAMLEKIPFACIICKESYREPIVTRCGHYFCEPCALKRYRKDPTCAACGASTNGVFNSAKKLKKLLEKKREREEKKKREAEEAGEEET